MHIFKINVLFQTDMEDIDAQCELEESVKTTISNLNNAEYISSEIKNISNNLNYGKCKVCGSWTSDHSKPFSIYEFSNGIMTHEEWYCDLCVSSDSPCRF